MPNGECRPSAAPSASRRRRRRRHRAAGVMRLALGVPAPARCITRPIIQVLDALAASGLGGALLSATSTSPLGSTSSQRGWSRPLRKGHHLQPGAACGPAALRPAAGNGRRDVHRRQQPAHRRRATPVRVRRRQFGTRGPVPESSCRCTIVRLAARRVCAVCNAGPADGLAGLPGIRWGLATAPTAVATRGGNPRRSGADRRGRSGPGRSQTDHCYAHGRG
jgi:hypothetical protein